MTDRELMQQALFALLESKPIDINDPAAFYRNANAIDALQVRLAQPEQDDGYCQACEGDSCTAKEGCVARDNPLPQREWQGLTDEEYTTLMQQADHDAAKTGIVFQNLRHAIEAKLKEKNIG